MRSVWSCTKGSSVDFIWPLWNLLDATPEGRGTDWQPTLSYGAGFV